MVLAPGLEQVWWECCGTHIWKTGPLRCGSGDKILQRFSTGMVTATDERIKEEHSSLKIQHKIQKNWVMWMSMHLKVAPGCGFNKHVTPNQTKGLCGRKTTEDQVMIIRNKQVHLDILCIKTVQISKRLAAVWLTEKRLELLTTQPSAFWNDWKMTPTSWSNNTRSGLTPSVKW